MNLLEFVLQLTNLLIFSQKQTKHKKSIKIHNSHTLTVKNQESAYNRIPVFVCLVLVPLSQMPNKKLYAKLHKKEYKDNILVFFSAAAVDNVCIIENII
jgi:hypothetical protein